MIKKFLINNQEQKLDVLKLNNEILSVRIDGAIYDFSVYYRTETELILKDRKQRLHRFLLSEGSIIYQGKNFETSKYFYNQSDKRTSSKNNNLSAPLPGRVISTKVIEGENIVKGQVIAVIEAMKMEHRILAYTDGRLTKLNIDVGDSIPEGFIILKTSVGFEQEVAPR